MPEHRPTMKMQTFQRRIVCANCGQLGHRPAHCEHRRRSYFAIGVEIEGWWLNERMPEICQLATDIDFKVEGDGSLVYDPSGETETHEIKSRGGISISKAQQALHTLYPDKYHWSAGFHIHMSFADSAGDISALMSMEFFNYAIDKWKAWGTRMGVNPGSQFWKRLNGENRYCLPLRDSDLLAGTNHDRYRALNFRSWGTHKTMELRVLPLFGAEHLAHSAVEEWPKIVEEYLANDIVMASGSAAIPADVPGPSLVFAEVDVPALVTPPPVVAEVGTYAPLASTDGAIATTRAGAARALLASLSS